MLEYVGNVEYFESDGKRFCRKKPIVYSYLLLNREPEDLNNILFLARKNFKESYKLPQSEYNILNNPNIYQTFENSYWATSQSAVVNVSFLVKEEHNDSNDENKRTNEFFKNNFPKERLLGPYYLLFLSVLHQKYAMRHLTAKMGKNLDLGTKSPIKKDKMKEQLKKAREYQAQAASLKFRAFFNSPSDIDHINKYYQLVSDTFDINIIYKCFNKDIKNIVANCDTLVSKLKDINDETVKIFVSVFGVLVTVASLFNTSWMILGWTLESDRNMYSPQGLMIFIAISITVVAIFLTVLLHLKNILNMKTDIKERYQQDGLKQKH